MASTLMKSVSGIRGIVGDSFTPQLIHDVAAAFAGKVNRGTVVIGRDSRPTGKVILEQTAAVLAQCGCDVIDLGIVPTPTVQIAVEEFKAAGGIVISASHNPIEWNAFKLINNEGTFFTEKEMARFFKLMEKKPEYVLWNAVGSVKKDDAISRRHIERVLSVVNLKAIKKRKFKVVLDSVNGAGSLITQNLLSELGCKTVPLYCDTNEPFPRGAEPLPENLKDLCAAVKKHGADIGFAQDPDADRLALVDENALPIGEENTIALVVEHFLSRKPCGVVVNLSTTKSVDDIAARYGCGVTRAKVGEINVADVMRKTGAGIGGEGNGGGISPEIHLGRDSLAGIVYILDMMASRGKSLSGIVSTLPAYFMKKGKVTLKGGVDPRVLDGISKKYKGEKISNLDGLRIDFTKDREFAGGWVHLRSSNTEPIFRIIAEGKSQEQALLIYSRFASMFR
ncbi:MAG: phosphoglucosamine mutase [Leptospirales bacterium]|nr:phosphoglucosamine mutase [Leptospirales bacterium]